MMDEFDSQLSIISIVKLSTLTNNPPYLKRNQTINRDPTINCLKTVFLH